VAVTADGSETVVVARSYQLHELLKLAGVQTEAGDVVVKQGSELRVERATPVTVEVDGKILAWRTRAETVQKLFDEIDVAIGPYDGVLYNGVEVGPQERMFPGPLAAIPLAQIDAFTRTAEAENPVVLVVHRAVPFTIVEDGRRIALESSRPTVAMALREAGIRLGPADEVYPAPTSQLVAGLEIQVKHARTINLRTGNATQVIYTHQKLLGEALAEAGYRLGADDRVEPSLEVEVRDGMSARLVRVGGRQYIEREPIVRKTVFEPDDTLSGTNTRTVQGRDGVLLREYHIVIEDGVEVQRQLVREWHDPEPVNTVIYYASSAIRATGLPPQNVDVVRIERMYATWYNAASAGRPAEHPAYGITATGVPVTKGIVAVDPAVIPLGTRLYIPGYGFATAADTGGGIKGNMIDLGYPDGVQVDWKTGWVDVFILAP
jgi:resuscitation-promoting factor RpfB